MAKAASRSKFAAPEPLTSRPEARIAAQTEQRRAAAAAARGGWLSRPTPLMGAIILITLIGFGIASYTTVVHYNPSALACTSTKAGGGSPCLTVQFSQWNNVAGVPVAILGMVGYFLIAVSLFVRNELGRAAGFGIALMGFIFSLYLTYREAFSIHDYCEWCLGSAACMTLLTILLAVRFLRSSPTAASASPAIPLAD